MATLVLGLAGAALGGMFGGFSILGVALSGASVGGLIGSAVGGVIDNMLFNKGGTNTTGPRLQGIQIQESVEGASIPRIFGRTRVAGQLIWATKYLETVETSTTTVGGKFGIGGSKVSSSNYLYSCSFAIAVCEGPITRIERVWADGNLMNMVATSDGTPIIYREYLGSEDQTVDAYPEIIEGAGNNPAYKGVSYIIFESLPLLDFGNRIPQFQFEITRALGTEVANTMENLVQAVNMIPATGEFVYATQVVTVTAGTLGIGAYDGIPPGSVTAANQGNLLNESDFMVSADQLQALMPAVQTVTIVVAWFSDDLRAASCVIAPGIEDTTRTTSPWSWNVAGYNRTSALVITHTNGSIDYGGTPDDTSVIQAIQNLKSRGYNVLISPILLMDIPEDNIRPNPYSNNASVIGQPAMPWRGRITCSPAPGYTGSPDETSSVTSQIATFFTKYTAFISHYASLAVSAGGVSGILIGSELVGLTRLRSGPGDATFPAVQALKTLAATVKGIVGSGCKVGYAADWSEYHSYRPTDGSNDVIFNMDPLWTDTHIDFIGIDNYLPLSDWRDGTLHLDYLPERTVYDLDYLQDNIRGGEYYDWYYASQSDRDAQVRTAITDGAYSKPWVYRNKDLWGWWGNLHYSRPGGTENVSPTSWVAQGKQIWFTEFGCPATDKGANQPNVFYDPKSTESAFPYYGNGWRDDQIQRSYFEAQMGFWNQTGTPNNPTSAVYSAPMVAPARMFAYTWDARPFPYYPKLAGLWGDAANWDRGHWLNGRAGLAPAKLIIDHIMAEQGFTDYDASEVRGLITGYVIDQPMSARAIIEPLGGSLFFDGVESNGKIVFRRRQRIPVDTVYDYDLMVREGSGNNTDTTANSPFTITRQQESELPRSIRLTYIDAAADYRSASAPTRRLSTTSVQDTTNQAPFVMEQAEAVGIAEMMLIETWVKRETFEFVLPPTSLAYEPGDCLYMVLAGKTWQIRITSIADAHERETGAQRVDWSTYQYRAGPLRAYSGQLVLVYGSTQSASTDITLSPGGSSGTQKYYGAPTMVFMDLPLITGQEDPNEPTLASYSYPWTPTNVYKSSTTSDYVLNSSVAVPATIGALTAILTFGGQTSTFDYSSAITIQLFSTDSLQSHTQQEVFGGANLCFIKTPDGDWEAVQYLNATLVGLRKYTLTGLLRGQLGTEPQIVSSLPVGTQVVFYTAALTQATLNQSELGLAFYWRYGPGRLPITDTSYATQQLTFNGVGLRPYSPVQMKLSRDPSSGDITFTWIRRTRYNGDSWDLADVPLNEDYEAYQLDVYHSGVVVRTLRSTVQTAVYSSGEQSTDFGAPLTSGTVAIKVYQMSAQYGRGNPGSATLTIH